MTTPGIKCKKRQMKDDVSWLDVRFWQKNKQKIIIKKFGSHGKQIRCVVFPGSPVHRHVPDGPRQQHHDLGGAERVPHPVIHQTEALRESGLTPDQRQRLEDAGPQAPPGQVTGCLSFLSPWSLDKERGCWSPGRLVGGVRPLPHGRLDNSEFSEQQRLGEQMQVTEGIIGHECTSVSQQAAGSWRAPLMGAPKYSWLLS